jgi:hypothetical protein
MQNGKVGKGDVFSQENIFIALFASKSLPIIIKIMSRITISRMKVQQHALVRGYYFPQHH